MEILFYTQMTAMICILCSLVRNALFPLKYIFVNIGVAVGTCIQIPLIPSLTATEAMRWYLCYQCTLLYNNIIMRSSELFN